MRWWKVIGAAAFVGVAATGVAIARAERQRRAYTPDQVRDRLRDRVAQVPGDTGQGFDQELFPGTGRKGAESPLRRIARRLRSLADRFRRRPSEGGDG